MRSRSGRAITIYRRLQDLGDERLADMDARGVDRQIIGITALGVQILDKDKAVALAEVANDRLGCPPFQPPHRENPNHAAKEIERAVTRLGTKAVVINSLTHGEYLSDSKF